MKRRRKLWLIAARYRDRQGDLPQNGGPVTAILNHPLILPLLAAYTPDHYDVRLLDEADGYLTEADLSAEVDVVGITALTPSIPRAYELATLFRQRGVKVIMGGVHVSMLPDEALRYCDSVVTGEADWIWSQVLADFENGRPQPKYEGERRPLDNLPLPRWDLFEKKTFSKQIQTVRGCPFNCDFCSVAAFNGQAYRWRPIGDVVREIERQDERAFDINDDNTIGHTSEEQQHAVALFRALQPLKCKFHMTGVSVNMADNEELLKAAEDAGLLGVLVGFESLNEASLRQMAKGINLKAGVKHYKEKIERIQSHGIAVMGSFVFGYDTDAPDTFKRVAELVNESGMMGGLFFALTPFPGTRLYDRLAKEGRLLRTNFPEDWWRYGQTDPVFELRGLTAAQLRAGLAYLHHETTTLRPALHRSLRLAASTHNARLGLRCLVFNAMPWSMLEKTAKLIR
jgi:radical SAM superfamily enzyme YgiQ (UPF0313 family)